MIKGVIKNIAIILGVPVFIIAGCVSIPPVSEYEKALYTNEAHKSPVVIYRSVEESALHKSIPAYIFIDNKPFIKLLGREYVQIYLAWGQHKIPAKYVRPCELGAHEAFQTINVEQEHALYLEIVPGLGGMSWLFCTPFQHVPYPAVGSTIELVMKGEASAQMGLGNAVNEELAIKRRFGR